MSEPRVPATELATYLATLEPALAEAIGWLGVPVRFLGLPIEEWAGPAYAVAACCDPWVLSATLAPATVALDPAALPAQPGLRVGALVQPQKERLRFPVGAGRTAVRLLPALWGGCPFRELVVDAGWRVPATVAERPLLAVRPGVAVFATDPLRVIHRHLNLAEPATTAEFTDLLVHALLGAGGADRDLDDHDRRRDFHAAGVTLVLLAQLHRAAGRVLEGAPLAAILRRAAACHVAGDHAGAAAGLGAFFAAALAARRAVVDRPIHCIVMPHGGILFPGEGFAEYDWPEAAAQALGLYLDWSERFGYRFAPDIGAGTLEELAKLYPATTARLAAAWAEGRCEFVNGTWSQPYLHVWAEWDQDRQFELGLPVFDRLFGRRPTVFASQEMALHPGLPAILRRHGLTHAIHRSQNLGLAPIDDAPITAWRSPTGGEAVRALPAHALRSERRGGEVWRHLPVLLTSPRAQGQPFIALTSMMDQSFIDLYTEEIVRAHAYAPVWGAFTTPAGFFAATAGIPAVERSHAADDYRYDLDLEGNQIHGHETGGYSSQHVFMQREAARLRAAPAPEPAALRRLMDQEAHDCYIIPYFTTGAFMEGGCTDYAGPRYRVRSDRARAGLRFIRDAAAYPRSVRDEAPLAADPATVVDGCGLALGARRVRIDPASGAVAAIDGRPAALGLPAWNGIPLRIDRVAADGPRLRLDGRIPGFGSLALAYALAADGTLVAELELTAQEHAWDAARICWSDCVALEHALPAGAAVERRLPAGIAGPTALPRFHSLDAVTVRPPAGPAWELLHGGTIFFRQEPGRLLNRLWCYDEFCTRFWWAVRPG